MPSSAKFLNVDLDLRAAAGLVELVSAFGEAVVVLNQTGDFASLELACSPDWAPG